MKKAEERGKRAYGGITMLVMQGIKSEEIWNDMTVLPEESEIIMNRVLGEL